MGSANGTAFDYTAAWEAAGKARSLLKPPPKPAAPPPALSPAADSKAGKLLAAACSCDGDFTLPALTVVAWMADRKAFGMPGYEDSYPSDNTVKTYVYGDRGLIQGGFLKRSIPGRFYVTGFGRAWAKKAAEQARAEQCGGGPAA